MKLTCLPNEDCFMDGLQTMKEQLKAFGDSLGIPDLSPDEDGYACLSIDDSFVIHLVYDEDAEALIRLKIS